MRAIAIGITLLCLLAWRSGSNAGDKKTDGAKEAIATQFDLLKAGKAQELKNWFTERVRSQVTPAAVKQGQKALAKYTLDDLVADVKISTVMGRDQAKIKMKSGRTLTTLIRIEGKWRADTIWFR